MVAQPYWIARELAIVPRPRGGDWLDDEMLALRDAGIEIVVSMMEKSEAKELGLELEETAAKRAGMRFVNFSIPDRGTPNNLEQFNEFLTNLERNMAGGERIGIHCRGCIGRSSVVAVSLLIRSGISVEEAWLQVETARGSSVPDTPEQLNWVARNMRAKP